MHRLTAAVVLLSVSAVAQQDARIHTEKVTDHIYMLKGNGGNIGLSVGEDGPVLIDDQFAPMVPQIRAAVAKLAEKKVRFLINTHWHGDHTGGNERFGKAGAVIVAHANVRKRMSVEQFNKVFGSRTVPSPEDALPVVTFTRDVTLHLNGDEVELFHVEHAHTDGDAIVWFKNSNVLHMGDVFFNGMYPFIDADSGGSLQGMIAAVDRVLKICDEKTVIIPGHGPMGDKADLVSYRKVLAAVHRQVSELVAQGKTADEVVAAKPTAPWDAEWGQGFMKPERWLRIVYGSVLAERQSERR